MTVFGDGAIAVGTSQAEFVLEVRQIGAELTGYLVYQNLASGDLVESAGIVSLSLPGPNQASFSGPCYNDSEGPCTFTVTVHGNQQPVQQLCDRGHRVYAGGGGSHQRSDRDLFRAVSC